MSATHRSTAELSAAFEAWRERFHNVQQALADVSAYQDALREVEVGPETVAELTVIVRRLDHLKGQIDGLDAEYQSLLREARG